MLNWVFNLVAEQGGKGYLSSAYLNIPPRLLKVINDSGLKLDVLTSSPRCNGFYGANNVSKYLPDAYSYLEMKLLEKFPNIRIFEYNRPGWTFHAKGFWADFKFKSSTWSVCTIGSSNFNSRSLNTDLESQAFLFTKDPKLSKEIQENRQYLYSWSSLATISDLKSRNIKPLVKLASKIVKPWL